MDLSVFRRLWTNRAARRVLIAFCSIVVAVICVVATIRAVAGSSEFMGFRKIVQVSLVQDRNHYEAIPHLRAYPPFFAIYWAPFGLLPPGEPLSTEAPLEGIGYGRAALLILSAASFVLTAVAFTLWAAYAAMRAGWRGDGRAPLFAYVLVWVLAAGPMLDSVARCESDMLIVMPIAGAMYLMFVSRKEMTAGALLGLATAVKLTPGLFAVYLLCQRRWKALLGMCAAGLVCTVIMPIMVWGVQGTINRHRSWLTRVMIPYAKSGPEAFIGRPYRRANQSPAAALRRYLTHYNAGTQGRPRYVNVLDLSPKSVSRVAMALKFVFLSMLVAAWLVCRGRGEPARDALGFALVPVGMLLLSDVSLTSHTAIFVIPYAAMLGVVWQRDDSTMRRRLTVGLLVAFGLSSLTAIRYLKDLSTTTAAMLVLFGMLCYALMSAKRAGQALASETGALEAER